jgi:hypothetical protein
LGQILEKGNDYLSQVLGRKWLIWTYGQWLFSTQDGVIEMIHVMKSDESQMTQLEILFGEVWQHLLR